MQPESFPFTQHVDVNTSERLVCLALQLLKTNIHKFLQTAPDEQLIQSEPTRKSATMPSSQQGWRNSLQQVYHSCTNPHVPIKLPAMHQFQPPVDELSLAFGGADLPCPA
jgi:hypothetical protein